MSSAEDIENATAGAPGLRITPPAVNDGTGGAIQSVAHARMLRRARELRLSRLLRLRVAVDETGWLRDRVELVCKRERGGALRPLMVRVGCDASDEDVLADGGAFGRCQSHNHTLERLRQLRARLATMTREEWVTVVAGSRLDDAQRELAQLDTDIVRRQVKFMGHDVVRLEILVGETEFWQRREADLAPIIVAAEQLANALPRLREPPARKVWRWPWS